jgi:hypothetical protein
MPICPFHKQPKVGGGVINLASQVNHELSLSLNLHFRCFFAPKNVQHCFTTNHRGSDRVVFQTNRLSSSQVVSIARYPY